MTELSYNARDPLPPHHPPRPNGARWRFPRVRPSPDREMSMPSMPYDAVLGIIQQALASYDLSEILELRLVSRLFDTEVVRLLFSSRAIQAHWRAPRDRIPRWKRMADIHLLGLLESKLARNGGFINGMLAPLWEVVNALMGIERLKLVDIQLTCSEHDDFDLRVQELEERKDTVDRGQMVELVSAVALCHFGTEHTLECVTRPDFQAVGVPPDEPLTCAEWVVLVAVFLGETPLVKEMLGQGLFVREGGATSMLWHPMSMAAKRGRVEIVSLLIGHGAGINYDGAMYLSYEALTPLEEAALAGNMAMVQFLLEPQHGLLKSGQELDSCYEHALLNAAFGTRENCPSRRALVTLLLENGEFANINVVRFSLLLRACDHAHDDIALLMLESDLSIHSRNFGISGHWSPLQRAAMRGHLSTVRLLLERQPPRLENRVRCLPKPLSLALSNGHAEVAELLFNAGLEINGEGDDGGPRMFFTAAERNELPMMKFLVDQGLDLEAHKCGAEALLMAVSEEREEVARFLLEREVEVEDRFEGLEDEDYVMLWAQMHELDGIVEMLVEYGYEEVDEEVVEDARQVFLDAEGDIGNSALTRKEDSWTEEAFHCAHAVSSSSNH